MIHMLKNLIVKLAVCFAVCMVLWPASLFADEFSPALLKIDERESGWVDVLWKVPTKGNNVLALQPLLPDVLIPIGAGSRIKTAGAIVETASYRLDGQTLTGATLTIDGLSKVPTDVLIRISLLDGTKHSVILRSGSEAYTIPEEATRTELAVSYWKMGTIHILEGFDHLLFLLTLLLIVAGVWPLLKTVTAFTIAHSITLALSILGIIHIPPVPTEAVISLSILLLAVEVVRKSQGALTLSERYPWLIAFTFGLVHGLGFAGALSEIGVPPNEVPLSLLMFNIGVETGQVVFVITVSVLLAGLYRMHSNTALKVARTVPYAIGGVAAYWTIERIVAFL